MIFKKNNGEAATYENLNELFTTSIDVRNDLFGSYLAKNEINAAEVQKKVDVKIATYGNQLQNLRNLSDELKKVVKEENVKMMLKTVEDMEQEQAQALFNRLKTKLGL